MSKVKIYLDPGESIEQAKENLAKALDVGNSIDHKELYKDPLAKAYLDELNDDVKDLFQKMFAEIGGVLARDIYKI